MVKRAVKKIQEVPAEPDEVFELAAELFRVMSAPMRLKIISSLCNREKNVSELLTEIDTTQPNMSQPKLHPLQIQKNSNSPKVYPKHNAENLSPGKSSSSSQWPSS